ncbi:hypothetical protein ABW36_10720 [Achromobacter xylosoxidans]
MVHAGGAGLRARDGAALAGGTGMRTRVLRESPPVGGDECSGGSGACADQAAGGARGWAARQAWRGCEAR